MPSPNTDFSVGQLYTSVAANQYPRGVMAFAQGTGNSFFTTIADVASMSLTFTAVANRLYKASFSCTINRNQTSDVNIFLTDGSNTVIAEYTNRNTANTNDDFTFIFLFTASAGSVTRKVRAAASAGSAGILFQGTDYQYNFIIEDMGPS